MKGRNGKQKNTTPQQRKNDAEKLRVGLKTNSRVWGNEILSNNSLGGSNGGRRNTKKKKEEALSFKVIKL